MSPNTNYVSGRAWEYKRQNHWKRLGYTCLRTAGSHGLFDLVAISPSGSVLLIQCKKVTTLAEANRVMEKFRENPPLPQRSRVGPTQVIEVWVKDLRKMMDTWI